MEIGLKECAHITAIELIILLLKMINDGIDFPLWISIPVIVAAIAYGIFMIFKMITGLFKRHKYIESINNIREIREAKELDKWQSQ